MTKKFIKVLSKVLALALCTAMIPTVGVSAVKAESERNNSRKTADVITFEDVVIGEIDYEGDLDVYRFTPEKDVDGALVLKDVPEDKRWFLWIMDENWEVLARSVNTQSSYQYLEYRFEAGSTYYIVVCPWDKEENNFGGNYTLYLVPPTEFSAESNIDINHPDGLKDAVEKSDVIAVGKAISSHIENLNAGLYTVTEFEISWFVKKGDYDKKTIEVKVMGGGVADDTLYCFPYGVKPFVEGEEYLLFLKLYENSPASSLQGGAVFIPDGRFWYKTLDGLSAGFDEFMIENVGVDYVRTGLADLYYAAGSDGQKYQAEGYEKGEYLGEVAYNADSMTVGASTEGLVSNCLPIGTKLWRARDSYTVIIAEVNGKNQIFIAEFDENPC